MWIITNRRMQECWTLPLASESRCSICNKFCSTTYPWCLDCLVLTVIYKVAIHNDMMIPVASDIGACAALGYSGCDGHGVGLAVQLLT